MGSIYYLKIKRKIKIQKMQEGKVFLLVFDYGKPTKNVVFARLINI
jgi:hypothetical protein